MMGLLYDPSIRSKNQQERFLPMLKQPAIEEQPRYVIDDGVPQKEIKILSEEQGRILTKLLKVAGHALMEDEKKLILQLQEKLNRETERVKSLRKLTLTDKPLDEFLTQYQKSKGGNQKSASSEEEGSESDSSSEVKHTVTHVVGFKPEEVVRRYIDCWNQQKFGAEYDCFSRDFLRHDRDAYISARHLSYQQQLGNGGMRISFQEILSNQTQGGESEIVAKKTVQIGKRKPQEETDRYRLKLDHGRWLIYAVEPV